jgi:hypothetical protein
MKVRKTKSHSTSSTGKRDIVLFVGNDINNTVSGNSWSDLVAHLIDFVGGKGKIDPASESFPLIYEQIYIEGLRSGKVKPGEGILKSELADWVKQIEPNGIHRLILDVGAKHIITPNYDFSFETAAKTNVTRATESQFGERRYSLFRYHQAGECSIWHIHGDIRSPGSINLGYEQYSGYLQNLRDYVVSAKIRPAIREPLNVRLGRKPFEILSWVDLMLTKNVFIFGFRLDQVEIHLWWLLAYRARRIAENNLNTPNRISYFFPKALLDSDCPSQVPTERRLGLLRAFGVDTVGLKGSPGTESYYEEVLKKIK